MISERMKELLILASKCFEEGFSPFQTDWLSENQVTFDECMTLSEMVGFIIRGVAMSDEITQTQVMMTGISDGKISTEVARESINHVKTLKALKAAK